MDSHDVIKSPITLITPMLASSRFVRSLARPSLPRPCSLPLAPRTPSLLALPRRTMSTAHPVAAQAARSKTARLLVGVAAAGGVFAIGVVGAAMGDSVSVLDSVDTPGFTDSVRSRLRSTYACLGAGIAVTGASAALCLRSVPLSTFALRSPWLMFGGTIASMLATMFIDKENVPLKLLSFTAFSGMMGMSLAPMAVLGGAVLLRAAAYTGAIVGSLSFVAATSPSERFLYMGGPLAMGLGAVVVASLGSMFLPAASVAGSVLANVSLYGGLALFSGFVLYDTSKIITHAETLPIERYDPFNESLSIYMDAINIFVRMATILSSNKRK